MLLGRRCSWASCQRWWAVCGRRRPARATQLHLERPLLDSLLPWSRFRSAAVGWWVGWLALLCGSGAALCSSLDTPDYLVPYYLRDVKSRFHHYASVRKRKGGPPYMTMEDFVLALLASPEKELRHASAVEDLRHLFQRIDSNGDGYISFPEFRLLMALLTSSVKDVRTLFACVDSDMSGAISVEAFADVLRGLTGDDAVARSVLRPAARYNRLMQCLFGDKTHPRRCTCDDLLGVIDEVKVEVWKAEFRQFDEQRTGLITAESFAELLTNQVLGTHLPNYLAMNVRRRWTGAAFVSLDTWIALHQLMQHADVISEAVGLYASSARPITTEVFCRAVRAAGLQPPPPSTLDVIFLVFDRQQKGTIEFDDFMQIMKRKINYHYNSSARERKAFPTRLLECATAAFRDQL